MNSKHFTAVALMLAVVKHGLDLNAPITKYIPSFPDYEKLGESNRITR